MVHWILSCSGPGPAGSEPSEPPQAEQSAPEAEAVAPCGDFVCGFGEDCSSCATDCGECPRRLSFWLTEPHGDADVALEEGTVGALERALLADLEWARTEILIASYGFSRGNVASALTRALDRGVDVRLVTECENRKGAQRALLAELAGAGALVKDDRSSFGGIEPDCPEAGGAMHHKFVVVDRRLVWAGSANLTATDLNYNHNHAFRFEDEAVAAHFLAEWEELWGARFGRNKGSRAPLDVELDGARVQVAFSPGRDAKGTSVSRTLLLDAFARGGTTLGFAAFSLTDGAVAAALQARSGRVFGVVDATSAGQSSSRLSELCAAGIEVVVENLPGKVHHKLAALDGGEADALVVGGSANWSAGGFDENDETLVVVQDADVAEQASAELERLAEDPAHGGGACCLHSAEAFDELSPLCGEVPCVCANGLDDDFDGGEDAADSGCGMPFSCPGD